jgi:hypothetical protein
MGLSESAAEFFPDAAWQMQTKAADVPPRKRRINRGSLPGHLPRIHETVARTPSCGAIQPIEMDNRKET